jgi:hypothetical protein
MDDKTRELATSMASDDSFQRRLGLARAVSLMETKNAQKKQQGDYHLTYLLLQQQQQQQQQKSYRCESQLSNWLGRTSWFWKIDHGGSFGSIYTG